MQRFIYCRLPAPPLNLEVIAMSRFVLNASTRRRTAGLAVATSVALLSSLAEAHFNLQAPPNWTTETSQGTPQKDWPCGNEGDPAATGPTTPYKPGDKVTIKLAETVTHAGHYRVALATSGDMMDLPADMSRTDSGSMCEHDDMQATPTFPILADGLLEHTQNQPLSGAQTFDVTLPSNVTCDKCVLQVREYMQGHSSAPETATQTNGCYYHHCAFISITAATGGGGMSGGGMSGGGGPNGGAPSGGSGGTGGTLGMGGVSMGGAMGEAGRLMSAGGAPGTAGAQSGGHPGTGSAGMPGTGGVVSGTGGSVGASGTSTNTGAAGASTGDSGGSLGSSSGGTTSAPATQPSGGNDDGGCAVSPHGRSTPFGLAGALGVCIFGISFARRRR